METTLTIYFPSQKEPVFGSKDFKEQHDVVSTYVTLFYLYLNLELNYHLLLKLIK